MRYLLFSLVTATVPLLSAFEPFGNPIERIDSFPGIERASPITGVVVAASQEPPLLFQEVAGEFVTVYNPLDPRPGSNFEASVSSTQLNDALALGGDQTFVTMWDRPGPSNFTPPVEGIITIFRNGTLEEFAPRATTALGGGNQGFHYRYPVASADGNAVAMIGLDSIFPHFVVRATEGNVEIIAQESVTDFPDSNQKFTEFGTRVYISPDGSQVAFFGRSEGAEDRQGLFLYNGRSIAKLMESGVAPIDGAEPLAPVFPVGFTEVAPFFGANGELFIFIEDTDSLLKYENGALTSILQPGDTVDGRIIERLTFDPSQQPANGDLLLRDFRQAGGVFEVRYLRYDGDSLSVFLDPLEIVPGENLSNLFPAPEGFYATSSLFSSDTGEYSTTLYRLGYDGSAPVPLHRFEETSFLNPRAIGGGNFIFNVSGQGLIIGSEEDFSLDTGGSGFATAGEAYDAFAAGLAVEERGPSRDPDGDGRSNIREFAENTNPALADVVEPGFAAWELKTAAELGLGGEGTDRYTCLTLSMNPDAEGLLILVDAATTPEELNPAENDFVPINGPVRQGGKVVYTFRSPFPLETSGRIFAILDFDFLPELL